MPVHSAHVGNDESEMVVLYVALHAAARFQNAAELAFPVAVQDGPVYVALRVRLPETALRRHKPHVPRRTVRIVRIQHRLHDVRLRLGLTGYPRHDAAAGVLSERRIEDLRGIRRARAPEVVLHPVLDYVLGLSEKMDRHFLPPLAEMVLEEVLREHVDYRVGAHVLEMGERKVLSLAYNALVARLARAHDVGRKHDVARFLPLRRKLLVRQLKPVAGHVREADLRAVALGRERLDRVDGRRRIDRHRNTLRREVERDAEDVRVFGREPSVLAKLVGGAAKRAAHNLLADKLRAEGAESEDVRHVVRVPPFGQHRDGHDAADVSAEPALLADGVHHFAQDVRVVDLVRLPAAAVALRQLALVLLDLLLRGLCEIGGKALARLELDRVDENRVRPRDRLAVVVEVAEERTVRRMKLLLRSKPVSRHVVVYELRDRRVLADEDEAGRDRHLRLLPGLRHLLVVAVQLVYCAHHHRRQLHRVERVLRVRARLLRHRASHVLPKIPEHRQIVARQPRGIVAHRDARQFHDAALDGVHKREVADRPRKQRRLGVSGTAQEERRRGEVENPGAHRLRNRLQTGDPHAGHLLAFGDFVLLLALKLRLALFFGHRLFAIAVMRLVVDDEDALRSHQLLHHALQHLSGRFGRNELVPCVASLK